MYKKTYIIILFSLFLYSISTAQYESSDGFLLSPRGTYRVLNVFVNIIYDTDPTANPIPTSNGNWDYITTEGINNTSPSYLLDFMDISFNGVNNVNGTMTRLYGESSFYELILLGEAIIVNIKQSTIKPNNQGFDYSTLVKQVINFINSNGGLNGNTVFGNENFEQYDITGVNSASANGKFDYVQFIIRNASNSYGGSRILPGLGFTTSGNNFSIKVNDIERSIDRFSIQGVGDGDISKDYKSIIFHEFSHNLFGRNNFHASGGNHFRNSSPSTFLGIQGGYGLMGGYGSSLISCNAYDRWRLDWRSETNNAFRIAAQNVNSDIEQSDGSKIFYLRDFVTSGDAIRIKLPYQDSPNHPPQFIWIENHQIGYNQKLDFFQHGGDGCIPMGTPGIYAYVQIGKEILSSNSNNDVWGGAADNLRFLSAEGNWDMAYVGQKNDCLNWGQRDVLEYKFPNPFNGANDLQGIFPIGISANVLQTRNEMKWVGVKLENEVYDQALPSIGDLKDAFIDNGKMDIGSNPAPVNLVTYNVKQHDGVVTPINPNKNTRAIYLTGLEILFSEVDQNNFGAIMKVEINWNQYQVKNDVRWAGDIVLQEELDLRSNRTILIDQSFTPNQHFKDTISNEFSPPSTFTCEAGSVITLQNNSSFTLDNKSTFNLNNGSSLTIQDGATLLIKSGCTLNINANSVLTINGSGKIEIECNAKLCVDDNAQINLLDKSSVILLHGDYIIPSNCLDDISSTISGEGRVIKLTNNNVIANQVFTSNCTLYGDNIYSNENVSLIGSGTEVKYLGMETVTVKGEFIVNPGTTFEVSFLSKCSE